MKKLLVLVSILLTVACSSGSDPKPQPSTPCTKHILYRGPQGGCYYINSNGNKTYVQGCSC